MQAALYRFWGRDVAAQLFITDSGRSLRSSSSSANFAGQSIALAAHYRQVLGRSAAVSHGAMKLAPRG